MFKTLFLFFLPFIWAVPALAQDVPYGGQWGCLSLTVGDPAVVGDDEHTLCVVLCTRGIGHRHDSDPLGVRCPTERLKLPALSPSSCASYFHSNHQAVCYPPGTHPDDFVIPKQKFHERALLAFGVAFAAGVAVNALAPHLPEGLSLVPEVRSAYRDGLMMTSAELTADWRKWTLSASATNFQGEWSRPYARVQWTWAF